MIRRFLLLFSLFWLSHSLNAQNLHGFLIDANTGQAVSYAQVIIKGTERGANSDAQGRFRFRQVSFPLTLVISDIRYETLQVRVDKSSVLIKMTPKEYALEEVMIRPEGVKRVLKEPEFSVIDYGFYDDLIVMAVTKNRRKKSYIRLQDNDGKLLWETRLSFAPERFFEDCLGNLHLLSNDSAYQVYYDYERLHLLYPTKKAYLLEELGPCQALWQGHAYLQFPTKGGLIQQYVHAAEGRQVLMHRLADSSKIDFLNQEYDLHFFLRLKSKNKEPFARMTINEIKDNLEFFQLTINKPWIDYKILAPVYAPIRLLREEIGIFNFVEDKVLIFNIADSLVAQRPISFHHEKGWTKEVFVDPVSRFVYAPIEKNGNYEFLRIDPITLQVKRVIPIENHNFLKNYRVRNGYLYFVDRDLHASDQQKYSLYKKKI